VALVLSSEEVHACVGMADAIGAIEDMCRAQAAGTALGGERLNFRLPNGWMRLMPGALVQAGVVGYKEFHLTRLTDAEAHVRYAYHLFDFRTGEPVAMMDAEYLTFVRTAAASGAAIKRLAREDAASIGVIGSGSEARSHVEAAAAVRKIKRGRVYSRDAGRRQRFAAEMSERFGIDMKPVERQEQAAEDADILLVATNTAGKGTALAAGSLKREMKGLHINSIGSTLPTQRELEPGVWSFADRIVLDSRRLLTESGDALAATKEGALDEKKVAELHEVVSGSAHGRSSRDEITLYKSIGHGLQDVAVAFLAYSQAKARGLGRKMEGFQSVKSVEPN
jgi:ornithine cyclodeaminase/alanine dehydrogenase